MNNETSVERDEKSVEGAKREWNSPQLKTWGTVAELTQTNRPRRCHHGNPYPCCKCTPKPPTSS